MSPTAQLAKFPTELLTNIFRFLPWQDHIVCSLVCKLWLSIFLSEPVKSNRYVPLDPRSASGPCPRMHNLFCDIGLECTLDMPGRRVSKISFVRSEREGLRTDEEREGATIDLTNHPVVDEPLLHLQGWRYKHAIRDMDWDMGLLLMWNQRGYRFGGPKDREILRQDWFSFTTGGSSSGQAATNDIALGDVDLDVTVREFIDILGQHILKFDALRIPGQQNMRLRMGMYGRLGVVVVRNVDEAPRIFDLNLYPAEEEKNNISEIQRTII